MGLRIGRPLWSAMQMIDVKEAVQSARHYLMEMADTGGIDLAPGAAMSLEEVELSQDEKFWLGTFGFDTQRELEYVTNTWNLSPEVTARPKSYADYKIIKERAAA